MAAPNPPSVPVRRRRPPDRKQQILAAAAHQFWVHGYTRVSMADIAAAVGVGASALYRHFRGKHDLLVAVLDLTLVQLEDVAAARQGLGKTVDRLVGTALDRREFGTLWNRDLAHLPDPDRGALQDRLRSVVDHTAGLIAAELRIDPGDARRRARAAFAVLSSPSRHRVALDRPALDVLLGRAVSAVLRARTLSGSAPPHAPSAPGAAPQLPASRREAILAAAIRLFDRHGYPSVGMSDIGNATGIAGPSIYHHFDSKTAILVAALTRSNEALWLALHHALGAADSADDALERVLQSYVVFAVENPSSVSVLLSEVINLPDEPRDAFRRAQQDYVHEWVALLRRLRPEVTDPEARVLVHAVLAVVGTLVQGDQGLRPPDLARELGARGRSILEIR